MNTNNSRTHTHPLLLAAAVAVVLFCTFGIAAIMGWLPAHTTGYGMGPAAQTATSATAPAYSVGDSGTSAGMSSYGATGSGAAPLGATPQANYAPGPAPARDYTAREPAPVREPAASRAPAPPVKTAQAPAVCKNCGVVESVREHTERAQGSGVGAGAGAVVGGLLGNQIGGGRGRDLATVAGAVGGAVLGNQVEGNVRATRSYVITVRMDNGKVRTFHQSTQPGWRAGDQVRVVNGALRAG